MAAERQPTFTAHAALSSSCERKEILADLADAVDATSARLQQPWLPNAGASTLPSSSLRHHW